MLLLEQASAERPAVVIQKLRRILVATDGSVNGNRAVSFAFSLARHYGCTLELCYVLDYGKAFAECANVNGTIAFSEPLVRELEMSAKSVVAEASQRATTAGLQVTSVVLSGSPAEAIVERSSAGQFDAIVVGTSGKRGLDRFLLGSVADGILRRTEVPTFVVPPGPGSSFAFNRFLVAIDDSEPSLAAAAFALDLAKPVSANIIFNGVVEPIALPAEAMIYGYDPAPMLQERMAATAARLAVETSEAQADDVASESVVSEGSPAEQILLVAKRHDVDLILVGTHGRRGLRRLFLGSVAEAVVSRSEMPVAVIRVRSARAIGNAAPALRAVVSPQ